MATILHWNFFQELKFEFFLVTSKSRFFERVLEYFRNFSRHFRVSMTYLEIFVDFSYVIRLFDTTGFSVLRVLKFFKMFLDFFENFWNIFQDFFVIYSELFCIFSIFSELFRRFFLVPSRVLFGMVKRLLKIFRDFPGFSFFWKSLVFVFCKFSCFVRFFRNFP